MDDYWIYGGSPAQIYRSIIEGRPNGMPAWGGRLPNYQVWQIVAYVQSLKAGKMIASPPGPRSDHLQAGEGRESR
jgi:cytochrome c oxidase cbb3-type subunit 3